MQNKVGALPQRLISNLLQGGHIAGAAPEQVQPASLDCTLTDEIYRMRGSFLPRRTEKIRDLVSLGALYRTTFDHPLECNGIYLVRLGQSLALPADIYGHNNNKSSTGRVNLQARLLMDGVQQYDRVPKGYTGELWLEITPRSFNVKLQPGQMLSQLRFFNGDGRLSSLEHSLLYDQSALFFDKRGQPIASDPMLFEGDGITMSLDLSDEIVGYKCMPTQSKVLDFASRDLIPSDFFDVIPRPKDGSIVLQRGEFYILVTKEFIRVPPDYAVEMSPYDPTKGEFRTHYAGFFDPGWGFGDDGSLTGTPAVLEVFTHDLDFIVRDGQPILKMVYERLIDRPEKVYGTAEMQSHYQYQRGPTLSKHFRR